MIYCRNLEFKQDPDYAYLKNLLLTLADKEGLNLFNNRYDWCVKAITIQKYPNFYDWIKNSEINPFDKKGQFLMKYSNFDQE